MLEPIGFVDAHPVDHFPAIFGDHVIQVVHDPRIWAALLHLQIERGVHVHRDGFNTFAPLGTEPVEERANRFPAAAFADPQHPTRVGIHHHRGVTVPLVERKLIHHQPTRLCLGQRLKPRLQAPRIDAPNGFPVQPR
ncbi:hypothetical protein WI74_21605 [Burkholderia ubonensis]|nr:hypothetical protein WI74_21605 [Burkholderia ubonensis]